MAAGRQEMEEQVSAQKDEFSVKASLAVVRCRNSKFECQLFTKFKFQMSAAHMEPWPESGCYVSNRVAIPHLLWLM